MMHITKTLRNTYKFILGTNLWVFIGVGAIFLGCGKTNNKKPVCKMSLTAPSSIVTKGALAFRLEIAFIKGKCKTDNYKLKATNKAAFQDDNWTTLEPLAHNQTVLESLQNGKTLQQWLNKEVSDLYVEQGDKKKITINVAPKAGGLSSIFEFSIINIETETVTAGPIEVKWTTAN